jgi:hypothetical protein
MLSDHTLGLEVHNEREALANLLDGLDIAENASRQMALATDNTRWILISAQIGKMRETLAQLGAASTFRGSRARN